ncbi:LOW QUALITY PROTEIN: RING-H2 finger protein ATL43-like [Rutidosis leptorrhynchoides]|uniref:LOW QUALITY PROTEIN: RING-H2 finger protein ATL43-like n=1 Tax=Rutidosis leptorrhynchoides TaxID=125765 RepID=UPI003A9A5CC6
MAFNIPQSTLSFFFCLLLFRFVFADDDSRNTEPPDASQPSDLPPFKPTVTVISAVLIAMFSITFLLLLYVTHCKSSAAATGGGGVYMHGVGSAATRKNSGIDRSVIETLPLFRFSSLRGEKDGLECAVCLNRFEPTEVLRLLPKCKHAFHVECVDTWLDAHSTCPLCRYRVDPEDVLLIDERKILHLNQPDSVKAPPNDVVLDLGMTSAETKRVVGRHSSAGERRTGFFSASSFRRSFDNMKRKSQNNPDQSVAVGCFDRRKDGLLLTRANIVNVNSQTTAPPSSEKHCDDVSNRSSSGRRLEHRIIVGMRTGQMSSNGGVHFQRWSDVQPSDLLYLRSEMIISENRRLFSSNLRQQKRRGGGSSGRNVINERSMSEITGLDRFSSSETKNCINNNSREEEVKAGVLSRWTAWISPSQPAVQSEEGTTTN